MNTEAELALVMEQIPKLGDFGIGSPGCRRDLEREREELRSSVDRVEKTILWLRENVHRTNTINRRRSSYGMKHIAEKDIGYITNGVFIAAGIISQYKYEMIPDSPNVLFAMSDKSFKFIERMNSDPDRVCKKYIKHAVEILTRQGFQVYHGGFHGNELVWKDNVDVRTLCIAPYECSPFIVRISVDFYRFLISDRVAKKLGLDIPYAEATPSRVSQKGEISILPDEVDVALEWALTSPLGSPPFETDGFDNWSYVWSKRASDRHHMVRAGRSPS